MTVEYMKIFDFKKNLRSFIFNKSHYSNDY